MVRLQVLCLAGLVTVAVSAVSVRSEDTEVAGQVTIQGVVTDPAGRPVRGAKVLINGYEGGYLEPFGPAATADKEGRYELRFEMSGLVTVEEIWVSRPGYVRIDHSERFPIEPRQQVPLDFQLQPGEVISGTTETPGRRIPNRILMLRVFGNDFEQIHVTDSDGRFEFYVPQGEYGIEVLNFPDVPFGPKQIRSGTKDVVLKPHQVELSEVVLVTAFDRLWEAMDSSYSYYVCKPEVDWNELRETYRPRAVACTSVNEFVDVLKEMLAHLQDPHVWIETDQGIIGTFSTPWQRNWNPRAVMSSWDSSQQCGKFSIVGKTKDDGFGFVVIGKQSEATKENVEQSVAAIASLHDVPGFIVDLRGGASGGSEPLALELARAFCESEVVYAKHKRRSGSGHNTFDETKSRILPAGEQPFTGPVVCLVGQRCMSSGEALVKMMQALPHVITVGMTTRGASGNPQPVELPGLNARVYFSKWVDMLPNGEVYEGQGIAPDIEVNLPIEAYATSDPTWERGLEILRERVANEKK